MSVFSKLEQAALAQVQSAAASLKALMPLLEGEALTLAESLLNGALPAKDLPAAQAVEEIVNEEVKPS